MFPQKLFPAPARGAVTTFLRTHSCNRCHHELKRLTFIHFSFCKFQFFKSHPLDDYCVPCTGLPRCISFNPGSRTLRLILLFPFYRWRKRGSGLRVMPRSYSLWLPGGQSQASYLRVVRNFQPYGGPGEPIWVLGYVCAVSVAQSCPTLCNPMDCSPPGSSVHGILQTRILECGYSLLQEIFPTQGSSLGVLHCRQILYHLSHQGSPSTWILGFLFLIKFFF